jgi:hypothetical protein
MVTAIQGLPTQAFEQGGTPTTIGKTFYLEEGQPVWIPYGAFVCLLGLCSKLETNRWKKIVCAWPQLATKRVAEDFIYSTIQPVLDMAAIENHPEARTRMRARMILQAGFFPVSLSSSDSWAKWKALLEKDP